MIRLSRQGKKKKPEYQIVAIDKANRREGACLERLGKYFPAEVDPKAKIKVNMPAVQAWLDQGAQVSETVGQLLKSHAKS